MNYAVIWTKQAVDQLAQAWIDGKDRTAVQKASNRIDAMLGMQPWAHGDYMVTQVQELLGVVKLAGRTLQDDRVAQHHRIRGRIDHTIIECQPRCLDFAEPDVISRHGVVTTRRRTACGGDAVDQRCGGGGVTRLALESCCRSQHGG